MCIEKKRLRLVVGKKESILLGSIMFGGDWSSEKGELNVGIKGASTSKEDMRLATWITDHG